MSKTRRNHFKAMVLLATASLAVAGSAAGQGYAGPVLSPTSLNFGDVLVGTTSTSQTVNVSVPGAGAGEGTSLSIVSITLPAGYLRSGGTCPTNGAATSPCTILVSFAPTIVGTQAGNLVVTASIFGAPAQSSNAALAGNGVPGNAVAAPSLGQWGMGLLLAGLMATGLFLVRRR